VKLRATPPGRSMLRVATSTRGATSTMTASHTDETDALTTNTSSHGYVDFDFVDMLHRDRGSSH
jgi:hypothetical protein